MSFTDQRRTARTRTPPAPPSTAPGPFAVPKPLYSQVRDLIAGQISSGQWGPGAALPNETALSQSFGVSIGTIRRAVEGLEDMGIVVRRQGRGTFVAGLGLPSVADRLCRIRGPQSEHLDFTHRILGREQRAASAWEARLLKLDPGGEVAVLTQVVLTRDVLIGLERSVLPGSLASALEASISLGRNLYTVLGEEGHMVTRAEEIVTAVLADENDTRVLSVPTGKPLLQIERRAYAIDDRLVELRTSRLLPSRVSYTSPSA